jgi:hypothetical protein
MDNTSQLMADLALAQGAQWKAERERDEALDLLRRAVPELRPGSGSKTNLHFEVKALLAKHQPPRGAACVHCGKLTTFGHLEPDCGDCRQPPSCERCNDERMVMAPTWPEGEPAGVACPDCAPCGRCGDKREVVMPEGGGVRTRYMAPCPDCAEGER